MCTESIRTRPAPNAVGNGVNWSSTQLFTPAKAQLYREDLLRRAQSISLVVANSVSFSTKDESLYLIRCSGVDYLQSVVIQ